MVLGFVLLSVCFLSNMSVSLCRCCVLVSVVHPVTIQEYAQLQFKSTGFCVFCSLCLMLVGTCSVCELVHHTRCGR